MPAPELSAFGQAVFRRLGTACVAAWLGLAAGPAPGNAAPEHEIRTKDALVFRNGDLLYGALESIDPQNGIRWLRADATGPVDFRPEAVAEIQFPVRARSGAESTNACRIHLTNHDELEGNLLSVGRDKVDLQTWYAGKLAFARTDVEWIMPVPSGAALLYAGPTGLEGWTMGKVMAPPLESGNWRYKNGAFYATEAASIARDLKLPDAACLQFDLAWKNAPHLAIALYTDYLQPVRLQAREQEPDFGEFYSLMLNFSMADLLVVRKHDPLKSLGQVYVHAFDQKDRARVEIRASKSKHAVALFIDGTLIKQWIDPEEFTGNGTAVRLVHQGQGAARLSNIRLTEWDGQFDEKPSRPANLREDLTRLRNGDKVPGRLESLRDGKITIAAAAARLAVPWGRVKLMELAGTNDEAQATASTTAAGAVRAFFSDGGSATFRLEKWDPQGVTANSPRFGTAIFDPDAFTRIQFLPPGGTPPNATH